MILELNAHLVAHSLCCCCCCCDCTVGCLTFVNPTHTQRLSMAIL